MTDQEIKELENKLDSFYKIKRSYAGLKRILDESPAEYICSGTGRLVYKVSDTKVLKISKNNAGAAQNGVEADWALRNYGVAADWYDVSEDYIWIESEFCKKAKVSDFRDQFGYSFKYYSDCLRYFSCEQNPRSYIRYPKPDGYEDTWDDCGLLSDMYRYISDFDVPIGDLVRISSYGINQKGQLVLTDTGLNKFVYDQYYGRK